jgi:hypothetical protein
MLSSSCECMHNMYEYTLRLNINNTVTVTVTDGCVRQRAHHLKRRLDWHYWARCYLLDSSLNKAYSFSNALAGTKYWMDPAGLAKGWWSSLMKYGPFQSFFHATAWVGYSKFGYSELSEVYLYADQVWFMWHPAQMRPVSWAWFLIKTLEPTRVPLS